MNTSLCPEPERDDPRWPDLLASIYPLVEDVVRFVARRHRLTPDDATELGSLVRYKLVEDDYHVLRSFQNRSTLKTYLTTVVTRVWLDWQVTRRGKWRPSVAARRLGDTAIRLEQLLVRDRLTFSEACETLKQNVGVRASSAQLARMREALRFRARPVMCSIEEVDHSRCVAVQRNPVGDSSSIPSPTRKALHQAMARLPEKERRLLTLRFVQGWTVSHIARHLGLDQKSTYRQFARIFRTLRNSIELHGTSLEGSNGGSETHTRSGHLKLRTSEFS
jgi:RNA polymerase sigma factor (sigma-70 family)